MENGFLLHDSKNATTVTVTVTVVVVKLTIRPSRRGVG